MDDTDLIAAMAAGDDAALRELFSRHAPWLAARLRSVLAAADVEDVLQETFLAAWQGAGRYRPVGPVGGWLWGIARRQAALFLRRRGPAALILPAVIPADGRHACDPAEAALSRAAIAGAVARPGPGGQPGTRGVAADVRRGPAGRGGGRADGRSGRDREEPRAPGQAAAARGPAQQ